MAQRISGQANAPEQALKSIFEGFMQKLEIVSKIKFEDSMKDRVWNAVSGEKLKTLKETLIFEFCEKILGDFNEDEAKEMLEEHKSTGAVKNIRYSHHLQTAYELSRSSIIDAVTNKANSMTQEWRPEIAKAVEKEVIDFTKTQKHQK